MKQSNRPTLTEQLQIAFDFFNHHLWDNSLPPAILTLQRKAGSYGYHHQDAFVDRQFADTAASEIAMNPDDFDRSDTEILSTFVHEMAHHWQQYHGTPGRGGYHNQQWAAEMLRIGLPPYNIQKPHLMTGDRIGHKIAPHGQFADWCKMLLDTGFTLQWRSRKYTQLPPAPGEEAEPTDGDEEAREEEAAKKRNKVKYTCCGKCRSNVWGKPNLQIICGQCCMPYIENK